MIDSLSDYITKIKKDNDLLLSVLEEVDNGEIEQNKYENAFKIVKKQVNLCNEHLSKFKKECVNNQKQDHEPDVFLPLCANYSRHAKYIDFFEIVHPNRHNIGCDLLKKSIVFNEAR
jgi:hypothetical protein